MQWLVNFVGMSCKVEMVLPEVTALTSGKCRRGQEGEGGGGVEVKQF